MQTAIYLVNVIKPNDQEIWKSC